MIRMRIPQAAGISRDWHYDRAPTVPDVTADDDIGTVRNADNNDGQFPAVREGNEVGTDKHSEPGGGARSELSPEKAMRIIDTFDVDSVITWIQSSHHDVDSVITCQTSTIHHALAMI